MFAKEEIHRNSSCSPSQWSPALNPSISALRHSPTDRRQHSSRSPVRNSPMTGCSVSPGLEYEMPGNCGSQNWKVLLKIQIAGIVRIYAASVIDSQSGIREYGVPSNGIAQTQTQHARTPIEGNGVSGPRLANGVASPLNTHPGASVRQRQGARGIGSDEIPYYPVLSTRPCLAGLDPTPSIPRD